MKVRKSIFFAAFAIILALGWNFRERISIAGNRVRQRVAKRTVDDRLREFGNTARERWAPYFKTSGLTYPPKKVVFVAFKDRRVFETYGENDTGFRFIRRIPILAASGGLGPKLREGDKQVPEGIYEIESFNPNSAYHVSLRLDYPNMFDRAQAAKEGRTNLGGDIMIHGKSVSVGCLALGDEAAEDVFTLAADVGIKNVKVICSPVDFRNRAGLPRDLNTAAGTFQWTMALYQEIHAHLLALPAHE